MCHKINCLLAALLLSASGLSAQEINSITVTVQGDAELTQKSVLDQIRLKPGDQYAAERTNEDVVNLMKSGRFANIRIEKTEVDGKVNLNYIVEGYPVLTTVEFQKVVYGLEKDGDGNRMREIRTSLGIRLKEKKLRSKLQLAASVQYNDARRHADEVALREYYITKGYYPVEVVGVRVGTALYYQIHEGERVKIESMKFENAKADQPLSFGEGLLNNYAKARERRRWYNPVSWVTNDGRIKPLQLDEDIDRLTEFYHNRGFLDAKVTFRHGADEKILLNPEYHRLRAVLLDVQTKITETRRKVRSEEAEEDPDEAILDGLDDLLDELDDQEEDAEDDLDDFLDDNHLVDLAYVIDEGRQYRVGEVKFTYQVKAAEDVDNTRFEPAPADYQPKIPPAALLSLLRLKPGEIFHPEKLEGGKDDPDVTVLRDAYGSKALIKRIVNVDTVTNVETGTIDLEYKIYEGDLYFVELVKIEGNEKTKDFVIRRELAIAPGEPFDLGRIETSKRRLEGLQLFGDVQTRPEEAGVAADGLSENLVVSIREKNTGRFMIGGGFSTDYGAFAQLIVAQENFDIGRWRRPHFLQGGGQKIRFRTQLGGRFNHFSLDFEEPWLYGKKLRFTSSLYSRELQYYDDKFDVEEKGLRLGLERTLLGNDYLRGRLYYTLENTGIVDVKSTASTSLKNEEGTDITSMVGAGLVYDTRGGGNLPTRGQRSSFSLELAPDMLGSENEFYGIDFRTTWYFKGFGEGHVLELVGQGAMVESLESGKKVPYIYRHSLGGSRSLRGFDYNEVGPLGDANDYLRGNTMLHGTIEYSVPTPFGFLRAATFYDWGVVNANSWDFDIGDYNDNWGLGLRLDVPFLGPLRLDYGIPITTDGRNGGNKFNVNFGYTTSF